MLGSSQSASVLFWVLDRGGGCTGVGERTIFQPPACQVVSCGRPGDCFLPGPWPPLSRVIFSDSISLMSFTHLWQEKARPGKDNGTNGISPEGKWVPVSGCGSFVPSFSVFPSPHFLSTQIIQLFFLSVPWACQARGVRDTPAEMNRDTQMRTAGGCLFRAALAGASAPGLVSKAGRVGSWLGEELEGCR